MARQKSWQDPSRRRSRSWLERPGVWAAAGVLVMVALFAGGALHDRVGGSLGGLAERFAPFSLRPSGSSMARQPGGQGPRRVGSPLPLAGGLAYGDGDGRQLPPEELAARRRLQAMGGTPGEVAEGETGLVAEGEDSSEEAPEGPVGGELAAVSFGKGGSASGQFAGGSGSADFLLADRRAAVAADGGRVARAGGPGPGARGSRAAASRGVAGGRGARGAQGSRPTARFGAPGGQSLTGESGGARGGGAATTGIDPAAPPAIGAATPPGIGPVAGGDPPGAPETGDQQAGQIAAFSAAADAFAAQPALNVGGRTDAVCLMKAYRIRYERAHESLTSIHSGVARAAATLSRSPHGYPSISGSLMSLHREVAEQNGLLTLMAHAVERLREGETCFVQSQDHRRTAACYDKFIGPIRNRDLMVRYVNGFMQLLESEKNATVHQMREEGQAYINGELEAWWSMAKAAEDALKGLRLGNGSSLANHSAQFFPPHANAQNALHDIDPNKIPRVKQREFETKAMNANIGLEKAHTAWTEFSRQTDAHAKVVKFLEAHRETQLAAMDLALAAVAVGARGAPAPGLSPAPQFAPVMGGGAEACDTPPPPPAVSAAQFAGAGKK
ncbi:MAG: hypothetical protein HY554_02660 [Elusimicrobia bacterium]|nr:hypothetical protein [Elusimicrobiota bacterium]